MSIHVFQLCESVSLLVFRITEVVGLYGYACDVFCNVIFADGGVSIRVDRVPCVNFYFFFYFYGFFG